MGRNRLDTAPWFRCPTRGCDCRIVRNATRWKKKSGTQSKQAATEVIPMTQHILDNYDVLTIAGKNRLCKLVMKKATIYRTPDGELSVHIYPKLPR